MLKIEVEAMTKAIYPGSFDPVTNGHLDIAIRSASIFEELTIAVLINPKKTHMFTIDERIHLIKESVSEYPNIKVVGFEGLLANYMQEQGIKAIVKGLRTNTDFEYEFQMALLNKKLNNEVETFFMPTNIEYSIISSSMVKDLISFNGDISNFVPSNVEKVLREKVKI